MLANVRVYLSFPPKLNDHLEKLLMAVRWFTDNILCIIF